MNQSNIIFNYPTWFVLICLVVGLVYALVLYSKKNHWSKATNIFLATLRALLVSTVTFLLLAPVIKTTKNTFEKPIIVFAWDNSKSIRMAHDSSNTTRLLKSIHSLREDLKNKGIKTDMMFLGDHRIPTFDQPSTDLSALLDKVSTTYENRNIDNIILISDGLINRGISPLFKNYNFKIHTIGLGDTTRQKDIKINALFANKVAYFGNQFPIIAQVQNNAFPTQNLNVALLKGGQTLQTKTIKIEQDDIAEVEFLVKASAKGIQQYTVTVQAIEGEITHTNNTRDAFVEVIDGREKILMIGYSPHPDFKAFKSIIEQNQNYSFESIIVGMGRPKHKKYDLIIAHQLPDQEGIGNSLLQQYIKQDTPIWYILGTQNNVSQFNTSNRVLTFSGSTTRTDEVSATPNPNFDRLGFDLTQLQRLKSLPPLIVPFGDYNTKPNTDVVLYQTVGNVSTQKPLLVLSKGAKRQAVLVGEGIWRWKLEEYAQTEGNEVVDDLVLKVVQYLSTKDDKRKLRVQTTSHQYYDYQPIIFQMEAYNDLYQRLNDVKVNLSISSKGQKPLNYTFKIGQGNSKYEIKSLPKGVYQYEASATILGKRHRVSGEFQVKSLQLEALNTTADHDMLRRLADQNGGKYFEHNQIPLLAKELLDNHQPDKIHSSEDLLEIINYKWLLFALVTLITMEWVLRKYLGSY